MDMSLGSLAASILFGGVGFVGFTYGKRMQQPRAMGLGVALMVYPYFVPGALLNWLVGLALTGLLVFWRE